MAYTTFDQYLASLSNPGQTICAWRSAPTSIPGGDTRFMTWFGRSPGAGSTPSTAATCTSGLTGTIQGRANGASGAQYVNSVLSKWSYAGGAAGPQPVGQGDALLIVDRLSHQGGLVGNVTSLQDQASGANLPTAALPRYTSGEGVWAFAQVYSSIGSAAAECTITYTNTTPTSGQVGKLYLPGSLGTYAASINPISLASGDTGVKSVESVQWVTAPATAGNWGITLVKPLMVVPYPISGTATLTSTVGMFSEVLDDACLEIYLVPGTEAAAIDQNVVLTFGEY